MTLVVLHKCLSNQISPSLGGREFSSGEGNRVETEENPEAAQTRPSPRLRLDSPRGHWCLHINLHPPSGPRGRVNCLWSCVLPNPAILLRPTEDREASRAIRFDQRPIRVSLTVLVAKTLSNEHADILTAQSSSTRSRSSLQHVRTSLRSRTNPTATDAKRLTSNQAPKNLQKNPVTHLSGELGLSCNTWCG